MVVQNDFILYASAATNIDSQGTYAGDSNTAAGRPSGIFPSANFNKIARQASTASAALASIMQSQGFPAVDNGNLSAFTANLISALTLLLMPPGSEIGYHGVVAPAGFVLASGRTIGDALSGATERANADCQNLFTVLWANNSLTVSGGRGASAALDWAANKTITLPDKRGRCGVGRDDMGGTAANRVTVAATFDGTVLGQAGGEQTHTLSTAELAVHGHTVSITDPGHSHTYSHLTAGTGVLTQAGTDSQFTTDSTSSDFTGITAVANNSGSGNAHNNMQPSLIQNFLIKL